MKSKKGVIISVCAASSVLLITGLLVYAYFTSLDVRNNELTIADNTAVIAERFSPPAEQTVNENVFPKEVAVENTGTSPCYVRVYADFSNSFIRSRSFISDDTNETELTFYSAERTIDDTDNVTTFVEHLNSGGDWVFVPEDSASVLAGYYYYTRPLGIGESTPVLFTYIKTVNPTEDDIDQFDIYVYSESMQLSDINGSTYTDYEAAWTDFLGGG